MTGAWVLLQAFRLMLVVAFVAAVSWIWTGDGRWGWTALVCLIVSTFGIASCVITAEQKDGAS